MGSDYESPVSGVAGRLQGAYGNRDVQRAVRGSLRVGPAGDHHEREADRVAARVAKAPDGGAHAHAHGPGAEGGVVDARTQHGIERARGRGRALPQQVRAPLERALGADFRDVRLHSDGEADHLNRGLRSRAFTTGRDIFLRRGQTDVASPTGRGLLAHELTHVVQQSGQAPVVQRMLWQITPDRLYDDQLNVSATRDTGFPHIFIDDVSAAEYEIGTAGNGDPGFVPATVGFRMSAVPSGFSIAGTQGYNPPPAWNPGARGAYWESPGGKTAYSDSPGGTMYKRGPEGQGSFGGHTRRSAAGYVNPKQFATNMLPLWENALRPVGSLPPGLTNPQKVAHFKQRTTQFEVTDSTQTQTKTITDYRAGGNRSDVVLGHATGASTMFNTGGHTVPRPTNYATNQQTATFHGLEDATWSAQSGHLEPPYQSPRPDRGSSHTYYDSRTGLAYTGGPWHSYNPETQANLLAYVHGRIVNAGATASADLEWQRARMELQMLHANFSFAVADQLLALIKKKGW